jgi:FtsP/CotA-like multicopper oxidase with cupredoxin domain
MDVCSSRSRRRFIAQTGMALAALSSPYQWLQAMEGMAKSGMPKRAPLTANPSFNPDVELELLCKADSIPILDGAPTRVLRYFASLLKGPENTLTTLPDSYLGRIMRFQRGQKIRIHLRNALPEPTITHWHGLHVPAEMDGHPLYAIGPGETFVYEFEMRNRASFNIYHPHPHEATAKQVYFGMAGGILVNDDEEDALGLPSGEYEIPIVIQDRAFDEQNQLVYLRSMHDRMVGFYGDRILVNGKPDYAIDVASRAYRLRILNGSTARIYKLAWSDGTLLTVLGVDGGLLEQPEVKPYVMLAPGERLDVWADFSGRKAGSTLELRSRPFSGVLPKMAESMMGGMRGGRMGGGALPIGSDYPIFTVRVTRATGDSPSLPARLAKFDRYRESDTANAGRPVPIGISEGPMSMLLNGRPYAYNDVQPNERMPFNTVQLMEIFHAHGGGSGHGGQSGSRGMDHGANAKDSDGGMEMGGMRHGRSGMGMMGGGMQHAEAQRSNGTGDHSMAGMGGGMGMQGMGMQGMGGMSMMMSMAHPIHLHGQYFQILSRATENVDAGDYASVRDGFINSGWKDTVLVMPGERIRIIKPFQDFKGLFMVHCHNLEHEDLGMMRDFSVE